MVWFRVETITAIRVTYFLSQLSRFSVFNVTLVSWVAVNVYTEPNGKMEILSLKGFVIYTICTAGEVSFDRASTHAFSRRTISINPVQKGRCTNFKIASKGTSSIFQKKNKKKFRPFSELYFRRFRTFIAKPGRLETPCRRGSQRPSILNDLAASTNPPFSSFAFSILHRSIFVHCHPPLSPPLSSRPFKRICVLFYRPFDLLQPFDSRASGFVPCWSNRRG